MKQLRIPAVFMRGGTSKALVLHERDLPQDRALWDQIFLAMLGSPDSYGRQLDGMGGGLSSLSKVCVVGPSTHPDADVDYTFAQVQVKTNVVDHHKNSGNMASVIGPFAVDEGLIKVSGKEALVRVHITNTKKVIHARFALDDGMAAVDGDLAIPGVTGTGAPVRLEFCEPGGAVTGKLLPTGNVLDTLEMSGAGKIRASLIDAATAGCFIDAADLGLTGTEMPVALDASPELLERLARIRDAAAALMFGGKHVKDGTKITGLPLIGIVSRPQNAQSLSGEEVSGNDVDLTVRVISSGRAHRALPLTGSLCIAVAAGLEGSVVNQLVRTKSGADSSIRIAMPSGVLVAAAEVKQVDGAWQAERGVSYTTQRRLFEGHVLMRASCVPGLVASTLDPK